MQLYHTTDAQGITEINPCEARMRELLDELDDLEPDEAEHPDVSLIHDNSGWILTVYPRGIISLENLEDNDESPRYQKGINRQTALQLWLTLSQGDITALKQRDWQRDKI